MHDLDTVDVKIELFYKSATKKYDSYYLKIYSTEVKNNRHEVLRLFRVSNHIQNGSKQANTPLAKSKIIEDGKKWELVAITAEEIREAIQEAIDKLNKYIEGKAKKIASERYNVEEMVSDISALSSNN